MLAQTLEAGALVGTVSRQAVSETHMPIRLKPTAIGIAVIIVAGVLVVAIGLLAILRRRAARLDFKTGETAIAEPAEHYTL